MQLPFTFSFSLEKFRVDKLVIRSSMWSLQSYLNITDLISLMCRLALPHLSSDSHFTNRPGSSSRTCHHLGTKPERATLAYNTSCNIKPCVVPSRFATLIDITDSSALVAPVIGGPDCGSVIVRHECQSSCCGRQGWWR